MLTRQRARFFSANSPRKTPSSAAAPVRFSLRHQRKQAWLSRELARAHGAGSNRGSSLVRERREFFAMPKCAQQRDRAAFEYADTGCGRKLEPITWRVSELSPPLPLGGDCVGYNCRHCRRRPVWTRERGPVDPEQQQHPEG